MLTYLYLRLRLLLAEEAGQQMPIWAIVLMAVVILCALFWIVGAPLVARYNEAMKQIR